MHLHNLSDPAYNVNGFKWSGGNNKRQSTHWFQENDKDMQQKYKILLSRTRVLNNYVNASASTSVTASEGNHIILSHPSSQETIILCYILGVSSSSSTLDAKEPERANGIRVQKDVHISRKWKMLADSLREIPSLFLTDEIFTMLTNILDTCGVFYEVEYDDDEESAFNEFYNLQQASYYHV